MSILQAAAQFCQRRMAIHAIRGCAAILIASSILIAPAAHAAKSAERTRQKKAAETERAGLQQKLRSLKQEITRTEDAKDDAADALADSEQAISEANRALHELREEQQQTQDKLRQLAQQQAKLEQMIDAQQKQLAKQLHGQYVAGNEDRIKLLLSGDNPARINRDLQYMGYLSQAQAKLIASLRDNLQGVESNKTRVQSANETLDDIAQEQREQKAALEKEKTRHAALLTQLSDKLTAQRQEAGNLERDEQRLTGLVDKLSQLIEEQRKADAAAEAKRQQQLVQQAQARAERQKKKALAAQKAAQAGNTAKVRSGPATGKAPNSADAIDDDEPPRTAATGEPATPAVASFSSQAFNTLRGQLRLPLKGELLAKFGGSRNDGPNWKGLFIRAAEGAEVKVVAAGRIVFADWLRGFGNLVIVDHGNQYMTIYGNNQSVLKHAGDVVKSGDVIANAGNSGGNEQSGLYFEMRHQGRAFDPLGWVTIR
jgi:murein hydrolase activator